MTDPSLTPDQNIERRRNQKTRNLVLGLVLVGLCVLFYLVTLFKGIPMIPQKPM